MTTTNTVRRKRRRRNESSASSARKTHGKGWTRSVASRAKDSDPFHPSGSGLTSAGGASTPRAMVPALRADRAGWDGLCSVYGSHPHRQRNDDVQQLRTIADLTRRYANGIADLTVRQNIQLHWVTIESLPEVLEVLANVGLNTIGACGDVVRNVTGCPWPESMPTKSSSFALVHEASQLLAGNSDFYNLPRKFKISIAGCRSWCCIRDQ